jgi:hypothetical protein
VGAESIAELNPWHMVIIGVSDGVVGPPCAGITTQLLRDEEGLLHLGAAQEPKLVLNHPKPVISLERLPYLGEERQLSDREVAVGGRSWSIPCPIVTTSRVGHKLPQRLSLLVSGLKDRDDSLSLTWRRRQVPVSLNVLGPTRLLRVFSIMSSKHVTISSEIKLSNMTNLNNGKGDNSTITDKQR